MWWLLAAWCALSAAGPWSWSDACAPRRFGEPCDPGRLVEIRARSGARVIFGTAAMLGDLPDAELPFATADARGIASIRIPSEGRVFARVAGPAVASGWTPVGASMSIAARAAVEPVFRIASKGAHVELRTVDVEQPERLVFRGIGDGEVRIPSIPADHVVRILAWSDTSAPTAIVARAAELPGTIELPEGFALTGRSQRGARVTASWLVPNDRIVIRKEAICDASGHFVIRGLSPADVRWNASMKGFATVTGAIELDANADLGTITFEKPRAITVHVAGDDGAAVRNARITTESGETAVTGKDGTVTLNDVPPSGLIATVTAPRYLKEEITLEDDVRVTLERSASIRARIVRAGDQKPAGRGDVAVSLDGMQRIVDLDETGLLEVSNLRGGTLGLEIRAEGAAPLALPTRELAPGQDLDLGTIEVATGIALTGRIVDQAGAPVGGATVRVLRPSADPPLYSYVRRDWVAAESSADGTFALRGLVPGVYSLWTESRGAAPLVRSGLAVHDSLDLGDLMLPPARLIAVRCTPAARCGSQASVTVEDADWLAVSAPIAGGRAVVGPVAAGEARLRLVDRQQALYERNVLVSNDETTTVVDVDLAGVTVRGEVSRRGKPVSGGVVTCSTSSSGAAPVVMLVHGEAGHEMLGVVPRELAAAVDANGRFTFEDLAAGEYQLTWTGDRDRSLPRRIVVGNGPSVDARLELSANAIEGVVHAAGGARRRVAVVAEQYGRKSEQLIWTGERFSFAGLDPGPARLHATTVGPDQRQTAEKVIEANDDKLVELTLSSKTDDELTIVARGDGGMPAANTFVFLRQGGATRAGTTNGDGRATFRLDTKSPIEIAVYSPAHGWTFASSAIDAEIVVSLRTARAGLTLTGAKPTAPVELWSSSGFPVHLALQALGMRAALPWSVTGLPAGTYRVAVAGEARTIELRDSTRDLRF